jgi:HPt (histidine-containing phosphotransfer) domain-containing protein
MADEGRDNGAGTMVVIIDEDIRDLIPEYLENRRRDVAEILSALDRGDFETTRSLGHKMKGSGGGYGFDEITDIGRACEEASRRAEPEEIRKQAVRLQRYLDNVVIVYRP